MLSACCHAEVDIAYGDRASAYADEPAQWFVCQKCSKACDLAPAPGPDLHLGGEEDD